MTCVERAESVEVMAVGAGDLASRMASPVSASRM